MSTVAEITADLIRGKAYYSGLNAEHIADLKRGCYTCTPANYLFLGDLIKSLEWEITKPTVSDIAEANYQSMLLIIGNQQATPPTVDAGANQSVTVDGTAIFTAVATPGSSPIVGYLWEKVSGGSITLANTTTASVTASSFGVGNFVLKVTVTDQNGLTASDTVTLTGLAQTVQIRWGAFDTEPDLATAVLPNTFNVTQGATEINVPFGIASNNKYIVWSQPSTEPDKTNWFNSIFNYGTVPDGAMKAQVIAGGRDIIGSRDIFSFDSANYSLQFTV